jgi:hypothetical protein
MWQPALGGVAIGAMLLPIPEGKGRRSVCGERRLLPVVSREAAHRVEGVISLHDIRRFARRRRRGALSGRRGRGRVVPLAGGQVDVT